MKKLEVQNTCRPTTPTRRAGTVWRLAAAVGLACSAGLMGLPAHANDLHGRSLGKSHPMPTKVVKQVHPGHQSAPRLIQNGGHQGHGDARTNGSGSHHGKPHGHHNDRDWGPRGRPPSVRPHIPHQPPPPVVVVPPCRRGGPGITPC